MELEIKQSNILVKDMEKKIELLFVALCFIFLMSGLYMEWILKSNYYYLIYYIALFFGGYFATKDAIKEMLRVNFEIDFLMILAAVGSVLLGKHSEAVLLLFLFSLGHGLEHYAMEKAKKQIKNITDLTPKIANVKINNEIKQISVDKLRIGDVVIVKAGDKIPVDGIVVFGESSVNQAPITGESIPVEKIEYNNKNVENFVEKVKFTEIEDKYKVFSGTINGEGLLEIKVARLSEDSTLARLIKMINEAETKQSPTQKFTEKVEKYYVPIILLFVLALCFVFLINGESPVDSFYRAMRVLVAGSPCALAISTPSTVLSGIGRAAKERILIKGGKALEELGNIDTIAFDKTGTLTNGKPIIQEMKSYNVEFNEFLTKLYLVESTSNHPIAKIVTEKILTMMSKVNVDKNINYSSQNISGKGLYALIGGEKVFVGNEKLMKENNIFMANVVKYDLEKSYNLGHTVMLIGTVEKGVFGLVSLMDEVRAESTTLIKKIKQNGIKNIAMLSGDNEKVVRNVGKALGIDNINGELLPEDKLSTIRKMRTEGKKVAMVGDGINDAPAMVESNVAIAMGVAGSDIAMETADVALLSDNLLNIDFTIKIGKKSNKIIKQNFVISLGMIFFLIPAAIFGFTEMGLTVFLHEGSTAVVVLNALRLLLVKK